MTRVRPVVWLSLFIILTGTTHAQEFPVAAGSDTTFSGGAVYGGENGLVAVCGDASSQYSITAQLVGATGSSGYLIGSRISLGASGVPPGAVPIFDGTNYFLAWRDFGNTLRGQFVSTSGSLVGTAFPIASNVSLEQKHMQQAVLGNSTVFVAYVKNDGHLYAQRVQPTGSLLGPEIQIASSAARDFSISFDGTNYLAVWVDDVEDKSIFGQFVSATGTLVGNMFLVDGGAGYSDNPTSLAFDGTRYLMAYHESPAMDAAWTIMGRFVSTSGAVAEGFTLCDSSQHPSLPSVAFDGTNYLVAWSQLSNGSQMGRFFNTGGIPLDTAFVVFVPQENKIPVGGIGFGGNLYLAVTTTVNQSFSDGDVYGKFIMPVTTGIREKANQTPGSFALSQNYPNPFNPTTSIQYSLPHRSHVTLTVYNTLGQQIVTLVDGDFDPGYHSAQFEASNLASGVYLYRLVAGSPSTGSGPREESRAFVDTKKLMLVK